jgi:2-aminoadipate transaminase
MDRPGYLGAIPIFRAAGANIVGWDSATGGVDELEDLILRFRPKFLYVTPTFRNPSGQTWSTPFRRDVLELVRRYRLPVIEDDPYRELSFSGAPPPSLSSLAGGHGVIHIGSFAKSLSGALRLGWVTAEEAVINHLSVGKQRADVCSPSLNQLAVAALVDRGDYDRHLDRLRPELSLRHREMVRAIEQTWPAGSVRYTQVSGGVFLWAELQMGMDSRALLTEAARLGVTFVPGDLFYPETNGRSMLRLCFSAERPAKVVEGISRLAVALRAEIAKDRRSRSPEPLV